MNRVHPGTLARASIPDIGRWVPTATVHLAYFAVAAALCVLVLGRPFYLGVGLLLAVSGTLVPQRVPSWWLLLVLGVSQLWREPSRTDVSFYVLLAGVHLLHLLGGLARLVPWRGRMQVTAFISPVRRYLLVQLFAQATAVGTLAAFGDAHGTVPGLSIVAAALLGLVALMFARPLPKVAARD